MAAIPQYMRNGEGIRFIAEEMGLDNEPEPVAYHSCGFNTKSACTRLIRRHSTAYLMRYHLLERSSLRLLILVRTWLTSGNALYTQVICN